MYNIYKGKGFQSTHFIREQNSVCVSRTTFTKGRAISLHTSLENKIVCVFHVQHLERGDCQYVQSSLVGK